MHFTIIILVTILTVTLPWMSMNIYITSWRTILSMSLFTAQCGILSMVSMAFANFGYDPTIQGFDNFHLTIIGTLLSLVCFLLNGLSPPFESFRFSVFTWLKYLNPLWYSLQFFLNCLLLDWKEFQFTDAKFFTTINRFIDDGNFVHISAENALMGSLLWVLGLPFTIWLVTTNFWSYEKYPAR